MLLLSLIGVAFVAYVLWPTPRPKVPVRPVKAAAGGDDPIPPRAIVLDGSNIMFWAGDPSLITVARVIEKLRAKNLSPIAIFDANAGYKVSNRFMDEVSLAKAIGLPAQHVYVVDKGTVADEVILDFATHHNLRVVTNDRYRDWSVAFPMVKKKGRLVKGAWREGSVLLRGL